MTSTSCKLRPRRQVHLVSPLQSYREHGEVTPNPSTMLEHNYFQKKRNDICVSMSICTCIIIHNHIHMICIAILQNVLLFS